MFRPDCGYVHVEEGMAFLESVWENEWLKTGVEMYSKVDYVSIKIL